MDHIVIYMNGNEKLGQLAKTREEEIKTVVLAKELVTGTLDGFIKDWNLNGEDVTIGVKRV